MLYVSASRGGHWGALHTTRDCRMARSSNSLREATAEEVANGRLCKECRRWLDAENRGVEFALSLFEGLQNKEE